MNLKRLLIPALLLFALAGCGDKTVSTNKADTEGVWVDVGPLDYHIQGSRELNPSEVPDDRYLAGVPKTVKSPTGREVWFAVFLRIENKTDRPALTAEDFQITDTEGKKFMPIALNTQLNAFAYRPQTLGTNEAMPAPDSTQELDSAAGSMLLFKLPLTTIANRPLEFKITGAPGTGTPSEAEVSLDV